MLPSDESSLPTSPEQLLDRLAALGIVATTAHHPPVFTVAESQALRGAVPGDHCKTLLLKDRKGAMLLLVALEDRIIDLKSLHLRLGTGRLSFASPEALWQRLGVRPGSVTPFGLINDRDHRVAVVLDQGMMDCPLLNFHPLVNDRSTAIRPDDLMRFLTACGHRPRVVAIDAARAGDAEAGLSHPASPHI